ncbi:MAG: L-aspartate oxidase [Bdellovibrionales bacterium]
MHTDYLVVGSGLAGLFFALKAAQEHKVLLINKSKLPNCNSQWAKGGIAAVMSEGDSVESHLKDTLEAGAGLCDEEIVKIVVENGPDRIKDLIEFGVEFDKENGKFALAKEAAHSERRVLHVKDETGQAIHQSLLSAAVAHPNIKILENCCVVDLLSSKKLFLNPRGSNRCFGAYILDNESSKVFSVTANYTILATGGAGKTYLYTSNWEGATGDGIAMAYRAGARVANLEFMQFHPTCLYHPKAGSFLITEALRGEGAELVNFKDEPFMRKKHKLGSLAPRDIVARGIDEELKESGHDCVYLKLEGKKPGFLKEHFPAIYQKCSELGIDIEKDPIPVVPAAHYLCGGVLVNDVGETDLDALYTIGEAACTGLHGANRLASNSLLECIVFAQRAFDSSIQEMHRHKITEEINVADWKHHSREDRDEMIVISHMWDEIRRLMWNYVGIVRSNKRLNRAKLRLESIEQEVKEYYWDFKMHRDILELRNLALIAKLSVECAIKRKESRGIHYNIDYPSTSKEEAFNTIIG